MLPLVLSNVNNDMMSHHRFEHTTCLVSELEPGGLRCVEWDGIVLPANICVMRENHAMWVA
jgi:hypothetical protein